MSVSLAASEYGPADAKRPPLAILHGLFGSGRNWATIASGWRPSAGSSPSICATTAPRPGPTTMGYAEMAEDVRAALAARGYPARRCSATAWAARSR